MAARATEDKGWTFQELLKLGQDPPGRNYVDIVPPGKYRDRRADHPGDSEGRTSDYVSAFQGVGVGHFGSPGVALFFNGSDWVRLRRGD